MMRILREQAADLKNPPVTLAELVEGLARSVPEFAAAVQRLMKNE